MNIVTYVAHKENLYTSNSVCIMYYHTLCRPGDVIESVNGVNLSNVDHQDAICAIKENKGPLSLV